MVLVDYQFPLYLLAFAAGCGITVACLCTPPGQRIWALADLLWVVFGLFGALGAVVADIYLADSSRIERQIGMTRAATIAFDRDVNAFRLGHCAAPGSAALATLCDKADFLAASTARNAALPLFTEASDNEAALRDLFPFSAPPDTKAMSEMRAQADALDTRELLAFQPIDSATRPALKTLDTRAPEVVGQFRILARSYESLVAQTRALQQEWAYIDSRAWLLGLKTLAICLVSFAAPFRLGRTIADLRAARRQKKDDQVS
ncbi:hypothetical protein [Roseovarius sp. SYSU LYC5161]|uniref:hypothetical protein n=1 Tax=Roseovarius halophilus (ex Wu et al. 2025) TaxID=3376060 RepID=UPI00399A46DD